MKTNPNGNILGINGLGRIGKLTLWNQIIAGHFSGFVVNMGREVGEGLEDLIHGLIHDSTYGSMESFFFGHRGRKLQVEILNRDNWEIAIEGKPVRFLTSHRNPASLPWLKHGVQLVIDCTGVFLDPSLPADNPGGSIRGHISSGARVVIASAPFKTSNPKPEADSTMLVFGINHTNFMPGRHHVVSAASCTTTALSHMMAPLMEAELTSKILTASMSTIHASTNTQQILDAVPKKGAKDLRKNRSFMENIIITSTGAARALEKVMPSIAGIGFMADSVRIPSKSVSLVTLNTTFRTMLDSESNPVITRNSINKIYAEAASGPQKGQLVFTEDQHVSSDLLGYEAAAVIEGEQTHCRTGFVEIPKNELAALGIETDHKLRMPVTHSKIFGWYDNEYGCYVTSLGKLAVYIDKALS